MNTAISIRNLCVPAGTQLRLQDISLEIPMGAAVAIIGPNGAGKSTLLQALLGLVRAHYEKAEILGHRLERLSDKMRASLVSYVAQHTESLQDVTAYEWCEMARFPYQKWGFHLSIDDHNLILKALQETKTALFKDRYLHQLSGGERQRVYIAASLCQETPIIFLDEPGNFLDPKHADEVMKLISGLSLQQQKTVLCVTHDINQVMKNFTHCLAIREGRIAFFGAVEEVMTAENLSALYDYPFTCITDGQREFYW